jgi:[acyl-carrier-protein] S-malonyltransferase
MDFSIIFPGQGSQSVGMLAELASESPLVQETFGQASEILGYDVWKLTQEGPEETLGQTEHTQPALLTTGVAIYRVWRSEGGPLPIAMAGHSLGEYTALVCAGRLDFETAVGLVRDRGAAMQRAVPLGQGAMAAILGLEDERVRAACEEAADGQIVAPANYNCPGQVVIAGHAEAVARAVDIAAAHGARRAVVLDVSIPSHCQLMNAAAEELARWLPDIEIRSGEIPVFHNVDAQAHAPDTEVRAALVAQLSRPVLWSDCIRSMADRGASCFVEMGPGKVLTGLMRRIDRGLGAAACHDPVTMRAARSELLTEKD